MWHPEHLADHAKTQIFDLGSEAFHLYDHLAYFHVDEFPLNMHSHNFYELNIVVQGRGWHYLGEKNFETGPGDVFAIPPHIRHGYWAEDGKMSIFHLLVGEYLFTKYHRELAQFPGVRLLFEVEPLFRQNSDEVSLFLHLDEEQMHSFLPKMEDLVFLAGLPFEGANLLFEMRAVCLICELSHFLAADYKNRRTEKGARRGMPYAIVPTVKYIHENYAERITLKDLAAKAHLSPAGYMRYFKKLFGLPPIDYLIRLRVKHAADMLKNGDKPVAEIAQDCGFFDSSHLTRAFRQILGNVPSKYREQQK